MNLDLSAPDLNNQAGSISALTADKASDQIDVLYQAAIDRGSTDLRRCLDLYTKAKERYVLRQF